MPKLRVGRGFAILLVLMFLLLPYTLGVAFLMVTIIQWEIVEAWYDDVRARGSAYCNLDGKRDDRLGYYERCSLQSKSA
jgi:hypothetical protein